MLGRETHFRFETQDRPDATLAQVIRLCPIVSEAAPAEILLEEVRRRHPGLLVMGAHGHHPLRDLFATSVTRSVLAECPIPAFIGA